MIFALRLNNILENECQLGEGLWVDRSKAAWVDIQRNMLFVCEGKTVRSFLTLNKPSIIYSVEKNEVIMGTDRGITKFNMQTNKEALLVDVSKSHKVRKYRSNDGGFVGRYQLLSFMHRSDPFENLGYVYLVKDESFSLLDSSLRIPNSFIEIEPSKILISDSSEGKIWMYQLDEAGSLIEKKLWAQLDASIAPDGGCLVGDFIFFALWDDAAIAVFDKDGKLRQKLPIPVIRPTNCKFDSVRNQLWVTSATEGLCKKRLNLYPLSGNTFVYNMEPIS